MWNRMTLELEMLARGLVGLPRAQKRALMLLADAVFMPAALWTALGLKLGGWPQVSGHAGWLYVVAVLASVPVFVRLGLYRAVVRFIGPKVIFAVRRGRHRSAVLVAIVNPLLGRASVPYSARRDLLGAGAGLRRRQPDPGTQPDECRVRPGPSGWSSTARELPGPRPRSPCGSAGVRPVAFLDDDVSLHGSSRSRASRSSPRPHSRR